MNELQQEVLQMINALYDKLVIKKEINQVDELRLILIKKHIENSSTLIDDFGKQIFKGLTK